jgi:hypothetical protein
MSDATCSYLQTSLECGGMSKSTYFWMPGADTLAMQVPTFDDGSSWTFATQQEGCESAI